MKPWLRSCSFQLSVHVVAAEIEHQVIFQQITSFFSQDTIERCEQNVDNHQLYLDAYQDFMAYFNNTKEQLQNNSSHIGEKDELESRLNAVKVSGRYGFFAEASLNNFGVHFWHARQVMSMCHVTC